MNRTHAGLIASLASIALLSLPLGAAAQPPAPQPPPAAQTPAQPVPQPPATTPQPVLQPPAGTSGDVAQAAAGQAVPNGALVLLGRIAELVDQSLGDKDALAADKTADADAAAAPHATGTSGTIKMGKTNVGQVSVDRSTLDEIKAEVEQLRIMISDKKP